MMRKSKIAFLFAGFILGLVACDNASHPPQEKKVAAETLSFVESSTGLPIQGQWRQGLAFFDVNGDGSMDILAPPPRKAAKDLQNPFIWLGNSKGEWQSTPLLVPKDVSYDYGDIAAGDFNGDGIPDMALAVHDNGLKGLKGLGNGSYTLFSDGLPSAKDFGTRALVSADFNNDGIADIAAVSEAHLRKKEIGGEKGVKVCLWTESQWQCGNISAEKLSDGLFADQIITGDVNGDGNTDIGVASLQHRVDLIVWIGDGKGGFVPFNNGLITERHYRAVAFADLNGDGRDDLVASITGFQKDGTKVLKAFLSENEGFKDFSTGLPDSEVYYTIAAADLDGDGVPEIVGGTAEGGLKVFSRKNGKWRQVSASGLPETGLFRLYGTYLVDLNRDGFKDIVLNFASEKLNAGGIRVFLTVPPTRSN
jgi:hypothetical protein